MVAICVSVSVTFRCECERGGWEGLQRLVWVGAGEVGCLYVTVNQLNRSSSGSRCSNAAGVSRLHDSRGGREDT